MDELELIGEEGFRAYVRYLGRGEHNHYPEGTAEYRQFDVDWKQAASICRVPNKSDRPSVS